ncbi:hypothetical protein [Aeoliella sp. SH292]|uniref:hypothetical protein n=1 Tax=Aeoliella sp. SH292 TaxID=3454464 RepID=UPI003F995B7C
MTAVVRSLLPPTEEPPAPTGGELSEGTNTKPHVPSGELEAQATTAGSTQFQYDDIQVLDGQELLVPPVAPTGKGEVAKALTSVTAPNPSIATPSITLHRLAPTLDPYFGGVVQLLSAGPDQPFIPLEAIRPPAAPTGVAVASMASLPTLPTGEVLSIPTHPAGTIPGRAVLLADGKALLLPSVEWNDEQVKLQLPPLKLQQPTLARVFVARADGVVVGHFDFMLVPLAQ